MSLPLADSLIDDKEMEGQEKANKIDQIKERLSIDNIALYLAKIDRLEKNMKRLENKFENSKITQKHK